MTCSRELLKVSILVMRSMALGLDSVQSSNRTGTRTGHLKQPGRYPPGTSWPHRFKVTNELNSIALASSGVVWSPVLSVNDVAFSKPAGHLISRAISHSDQFVRIQLFIVPSLRSVALFFGVSGSVHRLLVYWLELEDNTGEGDKERRERAKPIFKYRPVQMRVKWTHNVASVSPSSRIVGESCQSEGNQ